MSKCLSLWFLGSLLLAVPTGGDTVDLTQAITSLQADIARDTAALVELRARIEVARTPLGQQRDALQAEAIRLRGEVERVQRLRLQGEQEQARLRERAAAARESYEYAVTLLQEYARSLDTRAGIAETALLGARLQSIRSGLDAKAEVDFPDWAGQLLDQAAAWNLARLGGYRFDGVALDPEGIALDGKFAVWGPISLFKSDLTDTGGLAIVRPGRVEPGFYPLEAEAQAVLRALFDGASVLVPTDVTGGDAIRIESSRLDLVARLRKGGVVMVPLLATGGVALLLALWKLAALVRLHHSLRRDVREIATHLRHGDVDAARRLATGIKGPLGDIVEEVLVHHAIPREHLEEILHEHVVNVLPQAERHLGTLAVLGGVAPLLGLLGTVTGMIHTFQLVTLFGSGDARMLSGGISEALITTETGLVIAVPVLLVQAFLARSARSVVTKLERQAQALVNDLHVRGDGV